MKRLSFKGGGGGGGLGYAPEKLFEIITTETLFSAFLRPETEQFSRPGL